MPTQNPQPHQSSGPHAAAVLVDTSPRWLSVDDDFALGCECADPALQIERWAQESALPQSQA